MVNTVWFFMIVISIAVAICTGRLEEITNSVINNAEYAVELCFGFIGIYALWLGLMKVAEESGIVKAISKKMSKIMHLLFPDVPKNHPATGAITMNIIANMLGLGNAATPLGIKAIQELQKLNRQKHTASHAMCMFLIINTSSVQIIPATVIALRNSSGSNNPTEIIGTALIATTISTIAGISAGKIMRRFSKNE